MVFQTEAHNNGRSDSEYRNTPMSPRDLALYLGYDLSRSDDLQRLAKNIDWVDDHRVKDERRESLRPPFIIGIGLAIITGLVTIGVTWIIHTSGL